MLTLAVTGGIGSGKSVVSRVLGAMAVPVYDCDRRAKELYDTDVNLRAGMMELLGPSIYVEGRLNGAALAEYIFTDATLLLAVERLVHPAVREDFAQWQGQQCSQGESLCAMECAILLNSPLEHLVDRVLVVEASLDTRIARAMKRDNASREAIERRIAHQVSAEELGQRADYKISNEEGAFLLPALYDLVSELREQATELVSYGIGAGRI